jgi:hypothetical protein
MHMPPDVIQDVRLHRSLTIRDEEQNFVEMAQEYLDCPPLCPKMNARRWKLTGQIVFLRRRIVPEPLGRE